MPPPTKARHLTYCTNVHPGESVDDLVDILERYVAPVRRRVVVDDTPFPVGLRLGASTARALADDAFLLESVGERLMELDAHALTVNAFPFGDFHAESVKAEVYLPDWHDERRVAYTRDVADVLAGLPARSDHQSISTSPGSYKRAGAADLERIANHMAQVAAHLYMIQMQFDRKIVLAVEPEPDCTFETIDEWIAFYKDVLLSGRWPALEALKPGNPEFQEYVLRRHVGLCLDCCHQAVEYEDPAACLERLRAEGLSVAKVQLSSALQIDDPATNADGLERLAAFDEPRYLHQVVARRPDGGLDRFQDLRPFLEAARAGGPWDSARIHFHVPIFAHDLGALATTRPELERAMAALSSAEACDHLEIETYSWNVMPEHRGSGTDEELIDDIVEEFAWARERLERDAE